MPVSTVGREIKQCYKITCTECTVSETDEKQQQFPKTRIINTSMANVDVVALANGRLCLILRLELRMRIGWVEV